MTSVCLSADVIGYPEGGGHVWAYLNWALSLRSCGCSIAWLETLPEHADRASAAAKIDALRMRLAPYGLADRIVLCVGRRDASSALRIDTLALDEAAQADVLVNLHYSLDERIVRLFRRTALVDIDPGLLQMWMSNDQISVAPHDLYFTIGENVARDALPWVHTPPCVALDWWPVVQAAGDAPFTTVTQWVSDEWVGDRDTGYANDKRMGFVPFMNLPAHASRPLELATTFGDDQDERNRVENAGWRIRDATEVSSTPWDYQRYVQASFGEFSCAKPSFVRMANAWISDRTICYLASGKPAVVQHTGPSAILPDAAGLIRFTTFGEAAAALELVERDYARHSRFARELAERVFDGRIVADAVLRRTLST